MDHDEVPRISIPSMRVWLRIKAEYVKAVEAKLAEKLAHHPAANGFTAQQKNNLLLHAKEYAENTFKIAQHNIRVNGRDFDSLQPHEQDAEPFDEALDRRVWSLASTRMQWHVKTAEKRRGAPLDLVNTIQELLTEHERLDAELSDAVSDAEEDSIEGPEFNLDQEVLGEISAVTGELNQIISTQHERAERSRIVEAEYRALKP
ncbi:hypothetical protein C8R43DRAFT_982175 [Mycena crocata]|nr:hypothetical protein C8R43DRAFT_982175 [Mycena crocata]